MQSWQASQNRQPNVYSGESPRVAAAGICLHIVDVSLQGTLFVAPLFFGGRDALGRLIFVILACLAGVAWFGHQSLVGHHAKWTRSAGTAIALAALALVTAQLVPLQGDLLHKLAPRNCSLLAFWTPDVQETPQLGVWRTLSLAPHETRLALATLVSYCLLFFAAVGRLRQIEDIKRLVKLIAISAIGMSVFGLVQFFTSNGRFFWFYEYPFSSTLFPVKGSFTCRNHFAHFLVLGVGPLCGWILLRLFKSRSKAEQGVANQRSPMRSNGSWITLCLCLSAAVVIFAALLSFSRGGALALVVAGSVMLFTYYRRRLVFGGSLMGVGFLGLLVVGMLSFYGYEQVVTRLDDFAAGSIEDLDHSSGRRKIWAANVAAIQQGGLFGAGAGSHREIYPTYLQEPSEVEYLYAENGYLQVATENGWLGILILAFSIAVVGHWCWKANRHAPSDEQGILAGAVTAGLAASVAHSCVDFVWYIPSCMTLTIFLLACILRLAQLGNEQGSRSHSQVALSNGRWWALTGSAAAASVWAFSVSFGPGVAANDYRKYQLTAIASNSQAVEKLKSDQNAEPEFGDHQRLLGDTMIVHLRRALSRNPNSARAHQRLAAKYLTKFSECQLRADNAMSLDQIRDTVTASQFQSANELRKWLLVAFGKNSELLYRARFHALHALQLCPLQGRAYANLAKLSFLEGRGQETLDLYLRQAQRLRPHDCKLLYEIGEQRIQLRSVEQIKMAEQLWLRIFHFPGAHQLKIIHYLAGHSPAPVFLQAFQPDSSLLPYLWQRYRILGSSEDWRSIAAYAKDIAERECPRQSPYHAARTWHALASMQRDLGDLDGVLESYQHAFLAAPNIYWVRRELGRRLVRAGHYSHAETHLRWCQARHPEDEQLQTELIEATKRRLPQTAQRTHQSSSRR